LGKHSIIELNGKRYDATTGTLLGKTAGGTYRASKASTLHAPSAHSGRAVDGFIRNAHSSALAPKPATATTPIPTLHLTKAKLPKKPLTVRSMSKTLPAHQPERPKTLMRNAVKKPQLSMKPSLKAQLPAEVQPSKPSALAPKRSVNQIDPTRLARAKQTIRSTYIKRFDVAAAAHAPERGIGRPSARSASQTRPVVQQQPQAEPTEDDLFESAIAHATSHEQTAPKIKRHFSSRRKVVNGLAIVCAALVIGIFTAYLNLPTIELHVASMQAGFQASMPNYGQLGFSLVGPVKTSNGMVAMNFSSGDSRFTLTQVASNWDNQTLLDTTTSQTDVPPKTIQSGGRTIYLFQGNHAIWVNGGVRYDISGNNNLNTQEIASIADSM
jgi:hypothetical protein